MKWLWTRAKCDPMGFKFFFFQKLTKIAQRLGALPPDPHSHRQLGALPPDPRLWYVWVHYSLLNTSSKLDFYTFQQLVFALSLYQNPGKVPSGYGFRSSILRYLCPTKNYFFENFWWRHCVWFVVWAPPNQKSWLRLWFGLRILWIEYDANVHDFKIDITSVIGRLLDDLLLIRFRGVNFGCKIWCLKLEPLNFRYL